ncbi:MAG: hypothetical protein L6R40_000218 [Gallowayella cf. fulva]|nr:MAG: hypothetical protein L6R40_000218 [Xanthomendoza cf. fulva]
MTRTYSDAVAALNTLQTNAASIEAVRKAGNSLNIQSIPEMIGWCQAAGYEVCASQHPEPTATAEPPTGTKGKGSTSAFVSSILTQYLPSPSQSKPLFTKIGLYTSPHLRFVRERIRINNEPISEELFAKYFFEIWDKLEDRARAKGEPTDHTAKPSYFRFLTLMAFHTYIREEVDTAIIECGIGGEYDSTNVILNPSTTGITSLGIDHVQLLGRTIEEIAWHKSGIMKRGAAAYTVPQIPAAQAVLQSRAEEKKLPLLVVHKNPLLDDIKLGLSAPFQYTNASLAVMLASGLLQKLPDSPAIDPLVELPPEFTRGLEQVRWPGRCEIRREPGVAWHIDSGHTLESIQLAASWFASHIPPAPSSPPSPPSSPSPTKQTRILLFNQQTRDAPALARALHATLTAALGTPHPFTHAVFCTNLTHKNLGYRPDLVSINTDRAKVQALEVQRGLQEAWRVLDEETEVVVRGSIEEAVAWVRGIAEDDGGEVKCLVTGSVHLVGGFLEVIEGGEVAE